MNPFMWPSTPSNNYVPWWTIGIRLLLWVPMIATRLILVSLVFVGWGRQSAISTWNDLT